MLAPKSLILSTAFALSLIAGRAAEDEPNLAKDPGVLPGHSAHGEAFNEGPRDRREIDFVALRRRLAAGETWSDELIESLLPRRAGSSRDA